MNKKAKIWTGLALLAATGAVAWNTWFTPTQVAFVNYQVITLGQIAKANDHSRIKLSMVEPDNLDQLYQYDAVLINGMGLRITAEQRAELQKAAAKGVKIITTMATNPANNILSADSIAVEAIKGYLQGGGRQNYRNLLTYIRHSLHGKTWDTEAPQAPVMRSLQQFYHRQPDAPHHEEVDFASVAAYETFLKKHQLLKDKAPRIILTGQMGEPEELITALEKSGNVVYPVRNLRTLIQTQQADSIRPAAIINLAHGRLGDYVVQYLRRQNIPLFAPLNVNRLVEDWEADKMGMNGGFLSQSIVMPEIDGAIRPYALFAHRLDEEGLQQAFTMPQRLETFVQTVNNHIALQQKSNSQKRIAIYYYKGPGQSALTAAGMEVVPSLYNLLTRLKKEGYHIEPLPASAQALGEQLAQLAPQSDGFPRLELGNIALLPQLAAGEGDDDFAIVHGTDAAPPQAYIDSYLWTQHTFKADAMIHFGTHGSLEFTPRKQVALSSNDWPDKLVGATPHLYIYSIGDVGEGVIAKRRSYATLQSYLTPPFLESNVRGIYKDLCHAIQQYNDLLYADGKPDTQQAACRVKQLTVKLGIHRELRLDSVPNVPYTEQEIARIETFAEELANEKVTGELYTMGQPYADERIRSSVYAMATEPIAYAWLALDKLRGKATQDLEKHRSLFTRRYLQPARDLVTRLYNKTWQPTDENLCHIAQITKEELQQAMHSTQQMHSAPKMHPMQKMHPAQKMTEKEGSMNPEKEKLRIIATLANTIYNVGRYKTALLESPEAELSSLINALNGGYTAPSPGGDPIANPNSLPTGRNLYAVNAEATPSATAWERGKELAQNTIRLYRERHHDSIPRKVSYTLWSGEFVETEGATIAQVLYMLGVEPIRDVFGRVNDIRLIPSKELGRPRIDVVVQTSGQLRDIAASRLFLITRAVKMAAAASDDEYENYVAQGIIDAERTLVDRGLSPKEAREVATYRVFGGVNGNYGTGITEMVQQGHRWENTSEVAAVYLNNMGAFYGSEKAWEQVQQHALEVALTHTDAVVQPRQSNTWGALSLDHVYEFMGGMNLAVRHVTGKEPDAYLSDYRNRNRMRMQELKEAIGIESRTTLFNPTYIQEKMKGKGGSAAEFAEILQNTYGWEVMKPEVIDDEMWNEIYQVYMQDKFQLGIHEFFKRENPAALHQMTAVLKEAAHKGMWKATEQQLAAVNELHTEVSPVLQPANPTDAEKNIVLKRETLNSSQQVTHLVSNAVIAVLVLAALVLLIILVRRRRKKMEA